MFREKMYKAVFCIFIFFVSIGRVFANEIVFQDGFESYSVGQFPSSNGWFIRSGAPGVGSGAQFVTDTHANSGSQSMRLESAAGLGIYLHRNFVPATERFSLEAKVFTLRDDSRNVFIGFGTQSSHYALMVFLPNGVIVARHEGSIQDIPVGNYSANQWITLRVNVDLASNTYDVYIDDQLAVQDIPASSVQSEDPVQRIIIAVDNNLSSGGGTGVGGGTTAFFDDVIVSESTATAVAGDDQTRDEGDIVTLDGTDSFVPGGEEPNCIWEQIAGPPVPEFPAYTCVVDFVAPYVCESQSPDPCGSTTLGFQLTVDDGVNVSEPATLNCTIVNVNDAPVADAGDNSTIKEGFTAQLDGTASYDPENDPITYQWSEVSAFSVALLPSDMVAQPTFVAPFGAVGQQVVMKLVVDDGREASIPSPGGDSSNADTVAITVVENSQPVADAGLDQTKDEGSGVNLSGSGSDPDSEDTISYAWTQTSGTYVTLSGASSPSPSFTAPPVGMMGGEDLVFELIVTDDDPTNPKSSAPDEVVIHVRNVNDPPTCHLASANPSSLWPPTHKMLSVAIDGVMDADSTYNMITLEINGVTQDEPINGLGDGDSSPDAAIQEGDPADSILIRAERSGTGDGRVYEVSFTADDGFESCEGTVTVGVPHNRKDTPVDSGQAFDSTQQ